MKRTQSEEKYIIHSIDIDLAKVFLRKIWLALLITLISLIWAGCTLKAESTVEHEHQWVPEYNTIQHQSIDSDDLTWQNKSWTESVIIGYKCSICGKSK